MRKKRNAYIYIYVYIYIYMVLVGKPEDKKLLARPRCRWDDVIEMDF
jgi:hypothetical protein